MICIDMGRILNEKNKDMDIIYYTTKRNDDVPMLCVFILCIDCKYTIYNLCVSFCVIIIRENYRMK